MNPSRRSFLKSAGLGFVALGLPPAFLVRLAGAEPGVRGKVLVVIFQRGGMDGLNAVVPFRDPAYYRFRPGIAVAEPVAGHQDRAIDLDGFYGLHPALAPLKAVYDNGHLAIVHAVGSPDNSRSHFDAQDYMELGTPGVRSTPDGWLNRCLAEKGSAESPMRGVAMTPRTPRILAGNMATLTISSIDEFRLRNEALSSSLQRLYTDSEDPLFRRGGQSLFRAMAMLQAVEKTIPPATAAYPNGRFGRSLRQIARLIKSDVGLELAFAEIEGWDTHVNQGGATGQMASRLRELGEGVKAFYDDVGDRMEDVVVLTLSEFGRTARENGNRGTDHGHANVMFALGGKIRGGRVYGRWPGLAPEVLHEGRDLALTTDYRSVCSEALKGHLGVAATAKIFPGLRPSAPLGLLG